MKNQNIQTILIDEIDENTWMISDTHFGHDAILKYETCRIESMKVKGFRDHDEWLVYNWNETVSENDLVFHLGDFAFKKEEVFYRLNGRIIMLIGNHDIYSLNKYRSFEKRYPEKFKLIEGVNVESALPELKGLSGLICEVKNKKIMFSHYPLISEDPFTRGKAKESRDVMAKIFKKEKCDINIHGHIHSKDDFTDKRREVNISLERIGFKPVRLGDLIK